MPVRRQKRYGMRLSHADRVWDDEIHVNTHSRVCFAGISQTILMYLPRMYCPNSTVVRGRKLRHHNFSQFCLAPISATDFHLSSKSLPQTCAIESTNRRFIHKSSSSFVKRAQNASDSPYPRQIAALEDLTCSLLPIHLIWPLHLPRLSL